MIPDFLQPFASQINQQALPSIHIKATPLAEESLSNQCSKFGGLPFLPLSVPYPAQTDGRPMLLLAQLNLQDLVPNNLLPPAGLLQFYVAAHDWVSADPEDTLVLFLEPDQLEEPGLQDFGFLPTDHFAQSPIHTEHSLTFTPAVDYGNPDDVRFSLELDGMPLDEYMARLPEAKRTECDDFFDGFGHKVGGYAAFTQGDPRRAGQEQDIQLLQIDMDERIMFGDSGLAHFFIDPQALQKREFTKVYFYWDCC